MKTRVAKVRAGDSIRLFSLRELGDAMRWGEIARLNALAYPYITSSIDPDDRARGTVIWGDSLQIPIGNTQYTPLEPEIIYGRDIRLHQGKVPIHEGDWEIIDGSANLSAALLRRVTTPTGDLLPHPTYGCDVHTLLGFKIRPIAAMLGSGSIKGALLRDPRVLSVEKITPDDEGDVARFSAKITPVGGTDSLDINLVLPWSL